MNKQNVLLKKAAQNAFQNACGSFSNNEFSVLGIVSVQGDFWKEQRRFSQTVLKDLGIGKSVIEQKIVEELSFFTERLKELSTSPFDRRDTLQVAVANVIGNVIWGKRKDYTDMEFNQFMNMLRTSFMIVGNMGALTVLPFLR